MYVFLIIKIADRRVLWRHFRSTSGFIGCWKNFSQRFLLHQKIRRKISGEVLGGIFHLWLHLVGVIIDFDPFVSFLTNKSAIVKITHFKWGVNGYTSVSILFRIKSSETKLWVEGIQLNLNFSVSKTGRIWPLKTCPNFWNIFYLNFSKHSWYFTCVTFISDIFHCKISHMFV